MPGTDANPDADAAIPGTDANADSKIIGADANVDLRPIVCDGDALVGDARASNEFRWDDSSFSIRGVGTATTLRSAGGITRLELTGHYESGTVGGVDWDVTATLTGGEPILAGTYVCGQDAVAGYRVAPRTGGTKCWASTPTADCPGQVASCTFTLDQQIWPGCFDAIARGTFSMILTGDDAGTVTLTNGTFDVQIVQPVPPS